MCFLFMCTHIYLSVSLYTVNHISHTHTHTHRVNFLGIVAMKEFYTLWVILTFLEDHKTFPHESVCDTGLGVYI